MKPFSLCVIACLFAAGCASGPGSGSQPASPEELFRRADADGNRKVSREEFGDFMVGQVFSYYDLRGKGYVTLEDFLAGGGSPIGFREINRSRTGKITLEEAKSSRLVREALILPFDEADRDGSGEVSYKEFLAYKKRAQPYTR